MHTLHKVLTPFGLAFGLLVLALGALQGAMPQVVIGLAVLASVLALTLVGSRRYRRSPYGRAYRALTILVVVAMLGGMLPPPLSAQAPTASRTDDQVHVAGQPASPPGKLERPAAQPNRLATSPPPQRSNQPPSTFWADLDGDHDVDEGDLKRIAQFWNCADTDPCYDATYDFNSDGIIDALDMAYVGNEYDVTPPELTVTSPADGAVVGGAEINVTGVISDKHTVNVTVNGVAATLTDQDFTASVPVSSGNQALHVVATDEVGQATSSSRVVGVDNDGPMIQVHAPKNRQSVYILRPTIDLSYADFYTAVDPATLQVLLTDAGGTATDVSTYLAAGADGASGQVGFDLTQDTAYTLTASVADTVGNLGTYRTTFYVPADPATITPPDEPEDAGWVSGRVYDSSTCEGASENQPVRCDGLAGAEVRLSYAGNPTDTITGMLVTGPDGFFAFPVAETDRYWLRVEKAGYTYGQREAEVVKERSTPVNEIYLTPLDPNHQLCDSSGCDLTSSDGMLRVQIPAGAITGTDEVDLSATFFNQVEFLPSGGLPEGTWETYGFNLGGDSVYEFTKPITVWVNNTLGFSPNTPIPLGFWNQETQEWEHAGTSWVDDSGEWVVFTTTHFSTFDCNDPVTLPPDDVVPKLDEESEEDEPCGEKDTSGSAIILRSGILREEYELPPVLVLGEPLGSTFRYDSGRADPTEIIEVKIGLEPSPGIELGDYVQCELFIEGEKTDNFTFAASGLTEGGEVGHFRYLWDGRDAQGNRLPPGVYHYSIHVRIPYRAQYYFSLNGQFGAPPDYANGATGVYVNATAEDWLHGTVTLNTDPSGPFGMGWTLQGLQRLYEDEAGRILIDSGCCVDEYYFPGKNLLLEDAQGGGSASQNMPTPADEVESQTGEGEPEATPESETATQPPANAPAPPVEVESQPVERELEETPENPLESQTAIPPLANALAPPVESQVVRGEPEVTPESKTTAGVGLSAEVENPPENETTTDMSVLSGQNTPPGITVEDEAVVSADNQPAEKPDVVGSELQSPILRLGSVQVSNIQSPISNLQYPISLPPAAYEFTALSTNVSGTIITHTTWTTAGSPYILTGDVVITRSVTLTIEQGVVVKGQSAAGLTVLGHLYAVGTVTQPITFTSATDTGPYQWEGLLFDGGSGHLRHVTVRYAGQSDGIATSNVTVRNVLTGEVRIESSQVVSTNHS
ncbi:MAG: hypothetical protein ISS50_03780, partial [Anaerolineae bacterium]|nr:hypothetical protein [Anaerolineae bacterium]